MAQSSEIDRFAAALDPSASGADVPQGVRVPEPRAGALAAALRRGLAPILRRALLARVAGLARGRISVHEGELRFSGGVALPDLPDTTLRVVDPSFYGALALGGSVGAAESYAQGHWECDDLTALVRTLARNPALRGGTLRDASVRRLRPLLWLKHRARRNTRGQSRRNIAAHYDLGDDFFELFLDPTLTYSCAVFEAPSQAGGVPHTVEQTRTLEQAQTAKLDHICRKLALRPGLDVLEIGSGWGSFAIHAARHYGCRVTTTTTSRAHFERASHRVAEAGLAARVSVRNDDYRELGGRYDRLVSIEMIEAVGAEFFDDFFRVCSDRLRSDGAMLLQAILTPDERYEASLRSVDFIKRYIFPGGQLPSLAAIRSSLGRATDLRLRDLDDLGPHYARTLRLWHETFTRNRGRARALGYPEPFLRLWDLYLCACEGNFLERQITAAQITLAKPDYPGASAPSARSPRSRRSGAPARCRPSSTSR